MTQAQFAALLGVSKQTVFMRESKGGQLGFSDGSKAALREVQNIDAAEARELRKARK